MNSLTYRNMIVRSYREALRIEQLFQHDIGRIVSAGGIVPQHMVDRRNDASTLKEILCGIWIRETTPEPAESLLLLEAVE